MMKKVLLILVLGALLLMTGCSNNSSVGDNWKTFIGGTQGVELRFETEAPPSEINVGDEFNVYVILENKGEYTVNEGDYTVTVKGFSPAEFGTSSSLLTTAPEEDLVANVLDPDTGETLESYEVYVALPTGDDNMLSYQGGIAGNTPFPFHADVCYRYMTKANAQLCVKEDLTKTTDTKVCTISGVQPISSSGAPVQITDFKEAGAGGDAVRFSFKVIAANTGGEISELDSNCAHDHLSEDRVFVTVNSNLASVPSCNGFTGGNHSENSGYVKLSGGSRQVTCTQTISSDEKGDYIKILNITAEYEYEQSISTEVLIKPQIQ